MLKALGDVVANGEERDAGATADKHRVCRIQRLVGAQGGSEHTATLTNARTRRSNPGCTRSTAAVLGDGAPLQCWGDGATPWPTPRVVIAFTPMRRCWV